MSGGVVQVEFGGHLSRGGDRGSLEWVSEHKQEKAGSALVAVAVMRVKLHTQDSNPVIEHIEDNGRKLQMGKERKE